MAIRFKPRETIEIKPIDLQPKKALGVRLPFGSVGNPFILNYTTMDQVKSNLINMLLTNPGERFNEPLFGVGIYDQLFKQKIDTETLRERIQRQTELFVPEVEVINLEITQNDHDVEIKVIYRLLANNAMDAVTITLN
jgi:phage baseplate assembly protein W